MQKSRSPGSFALALRINQGDVDGRIIFDGFATAKNFSDWILNFSGTSSQVKTKAKKIARMCMKSLSLLALAFSTGRIRFVKQGRFEATRLPLNGTKSG